MKDNILFLRQWAKSPLRIAAIAPSSRATARIMTQAIGPETDRVIELGPGTGVFTEMLIERGITERNLTLVELNPSFAALLRRRFPEATVLEINAADIDIAHHGLAGTGAVLSGLGLPSMPTWQVEQILDTAFRCLKSDGAFYQITYGLRCPVPDTILERLGLRTEKIGGTFSNLPPSAVYRITR